MKSRIVIIGLSDTADRVYRFIKRYDLYEVIGFAVDREFLPDSRVYSAGNGEPIWAFDELDRHIDVDRDRVFVALLWNRLNRDRRTVYEKVKRMGLTCASLISPNAIFRGDYIGENCWLSDGVIVQERAQIGNNVFLMDGAIIGHRAWIKDHCFIGLKAVVMGAVEIGEQTFVGVSSTIFDETKIGDKCLIGACTAINRDVPSCIVCKMSPGLYVQKTYDVDVIEQKWLAHHNHR